MAKVTSGQVSEYLKIGMYMAFAFVGYKAIKKVAETFGLIKTKEETGLETATEQASQSSTEASSSNPLLSFNPNYSTALIVAYKKKYPSKVWDQKKQMIIDSEQFSIMAKNILDAKGYFNDDEDRLYNIFKVLQTQYQLGFLSKLFSVLYKKDLLEYLKSFLNADEIAPILKQVINYPQYLK